MKKFEKRIYELLHLKYKTNENIYDLNVIDNIIFNDKSHLVAKFKDYLITDDEYEFLKRYYNNEDSKKRLRKFLNYYHKYNIIFPNYSVLPEAKIIYKNINGKQKLIDNILGEKRKKKLKKEENSIENIDSLVFNSKIYDSIIKGSGNCISILSYDKDSNYKEEDNKNNASILAINELINTFDKIDFNIKNKKEKQKEKKEKKNISDNLLHKKLNIDINDINNNIKNNYNKIYIIKKIK